MLLRKQSLILLFILCTASLQAASLSDSIVEIPANTLFELRQELEIPANRNFIRLGRNQLNERFNDINQTLNQQHGRNYTNYSYYKYNDYLADWQQSVGQSYYDCLERHRNYYRHDGDNSSSTNTIINQGDGNTSVIINNQTHTEPSYSSYIGDNSCIKPEHTVAILMLDADESGSGGLFRQGYQFKVKSVRHTKQGDFHIITIRFNHDIAKGIRIITTQSPKDIRIAQLQYRDIEDGFWAGLGSALATMTDIGGNHFIIQLPAKHYYD